MNPLASWGLRRMCVQWVQVLQVLVCGSRASMSACSLRMAFAGPQRRPSPAPAPLRRASSNPHKHAPLHVRAGAVADDLRPLQVGRALEHLDGGVPGPLQQHTFKALVNACNVEGTPA